VSLYPTEDDQLELNQIKYLKDRYPNHVIGFSSHEYHDWHSSMLISYALGVRTWERHIDIVYDDVPVSPYCSVPSQADEWFKSFHKAVEMLGNSATARRVISKEETKYLDALVRGVYARRDLPKGYELSSRSFSQDFKLAVPLRKGQLSTREILNGLKITQGLSAGDPVTIDNIDGPYASQAELRQQILERGL
jgi:N-acetylneuraminate synthase